MDDLSYANLKEQLVNPYYNYEYLIKKDYTKEISDSLKSKKHNILER